MGRTRSRILEAALKLYNENGLASVSQRDITEHLSISPGNLTYHFAKKEDIEKALYFELVSAFDELFASSMDSANAPGGDWLRLIDHMFGLIHRYRFVFLDFTQLMRGHPDIAEYHRQLTQKRNRQFMEIISAFVAGGLMRPAELPEEYENLNRRIQLQSDFFPANVEILDGGFRSDHLPVYRELFVQTLYPYLTEAGRHLLLRKRGAQGNT